MDEYCREVQEIVCYLPVDYLTVTVERKVLDVRLLPVNSEEIPPPGPSFRIEKPAGGVAAVWTKGTNHSLMAHRARATAYYVLKIPVSSAETRVTVNP